jgi:hypothetical protein
MIIRTYGGREHAVSHEQAARAVKAIAKGVKYITINDSVIATADIREIGPGGFTEVDVLKEDKRIEAPDNSLKGSLKTRLKKTNPQLFARLYD